MGLFDSVEERAKKKKIKEEEKKEKRKEFERIMSSNPEITIKTNARTNVENKSKGLVCCPKCGSTQLTAQKKGFGLLKGVRQEY